MEHPLLRRVVLEALADQPYEVAIGYSSVSRPPTREGPREKVRGTMRRGEATYGSKAVAIQGAKRLVAFDPNVALWDAHLGVWVRREGLDSVVCDGDDALDDHFPTVDGVSGRDVGGDVGGRKRRT